MRMVYVRTSQASGACVHADGGFSVHNAQQCTAYDAVT